MALRFTGAASDAAKNTESQAPVVPPTAPATTAPATSAVPVAPEAGAGTPPVEANTGDKKLTFKEKVTKEFKAAGKERMKAEAANPELKAQTGIWQKSIGFVCCLTNPAKTSNTTQEGVSNQVAEVPAGYLLHAYGDILVPKCSREGINKTDSMGYSSVEWVPVAAGQDFQVTIAENAILISDIRVNGLYAGAEDFPVDMLATASKRTSREEDGYTFKVSLKSARVSGVENKRSVRSVYKSIAKKKIDPATGKEVQGNGLYSYEVLPEYAEKFGYLFQQIQRKPRAEGESQYTRKELGETAALVAASFRAFMDGQGRAQQQ